MSKNNTRPNVCRKKLAMKSYAARRSRRELPGHMWAASGGHSTGINAQAGSLRLLPCIVLTVAVASVLPAQETELSQSTVPTAKRPKTASVATIDGPVIPGLLQKAIPQGITFASAEKRILISHYFENSPSCVSVLSSSTGEMTACVTLQDSAGQPHRGHVGGIAVVGQSLLVASDGQVLQYKLSDFLAMQTPPAAAAIALRKCETKASFCTATAELLLVGEFAYGSKFPTKSSHRRKDRKGVRKYAWICGYAANDLLGKPTCIISVRQRVQGICVAGDRVYLSVSYGRTNRSRIVVYRNPIGKEAHETVAIEDDERIPLWFLDGENYLGEIDFPPMSEGIVMIGDKLAVLTESGATKYRFGGKGPIDRLKLLDVSKFK